MGITDQLLGGGAPGNSPELLLIGKQLNAGPGRSLAVQYAKTGNRRGLGTRLCNSQCDRTNQLLATV